MQRIALVTGGTRGIGAAIGRQLKSQGYQVAATYHGNDAAAGTFAAESGVATFKWDVADFEACGDGIAKVTRDVGPPDILVNNTGITRDTTLRKMSAEQWRAVIDTNLGSMFNMCRHAIGGMRDRGIGRIINISSINGQKGQYGQSNYAAAKAGILGFTRALALEEAGKGISVNAIAQGIVIPTWWPPFRRTS